MTRESDKPKIQGAPTPRHLTGREHRGVMGHVAQLMALQRQRLAAETTATPAQDEAPAPVEVAPDEPAFPDASEVDTEGLPSSAMVQPGEPSVHEVVRKLDVPPL